MGQGTTYVRALSSLVALVQMGATGRQELRGVLRTLEGHAREEDLVIEAANGRLLINGAPATSVAENEGLLSRLAAHQVRRLVIRQFASAKELLQTVALLTGDAPRGEPGEACVSTIGQEMGARKIWNVRIEHAESQGTRVVASGGAGAVEDLVARLATAVDVASAAGISQELCALVHEAAGRGDADTCAAGVLAVSAAREGAKTDVVVQAYDEVLRDLSVPAVIKQVAQLLPLGRQRAALLEVLRRAGENGAHALIAHLMAAQTIDERRVFFEALVELRTGIPILIDALGHPQWYVVRNAANLLGAMRVQEADLPLEALLGHRDARVREATAAALARIDTISARTALRRVIGDPSPEVRRHAISVVGTSDGAASRSAAVLAAALDVEDNDDAQLEIIAALGRLGTPDAVQKLIKAFSPTNAAGKAVAYRVAAVEALAAARGAAAVTALRSLLLDAQQEVREAAGRLIAATPRRTHT